MSDNKRDQADPSKPKEEGRSIAREEPNWRNSVRDYDPPPKPPKPPERKSDE